MFRLVGAATLRLRTRCRNPRWPISAPTTLQKVFPLTAVVEEQQAAAAGVAAVALLHRRQSCPTAVAAAEAVVAAEVA